MTRFASSDQLNGENLEGFIMKEPKIDDLKIDEEGSKRLKKQLGDSKKVKITINFDADILDEVKLLAERNCSPYQTFLNRLVRESLSQRQQEESRLDRIEKEIKELKKKFVA